MPWSIRFLPEDRSCEGTEPLPLSLAAAACDVLLEQPCARAACGRCRVRLEGPAAAADARESDVLGAEAVAAGWRLGCRLRVDRDLTVFVPPASRVVAHKSFGGEDLLADGFEPGTGAGVAVDIGSTTLAAAVVSLATGEVLATASALNPQVQFGADVMSRIAFAGGAEAGRQLTTTLREAFDALVGRVIGSAALDAADIRSVTVAGNPTMVHSLLGLRLTPLGEAPFQGERYQLFRCPAAELGLALPQAQVLILPGVGAHVGADAVAAALATRLDRDSTPRLLLDLGTNTEILLSGPHGLLCASAAAGPAFEGAMISHGMRAIPGAIDQVRVADDGRIVVRTIDDTEAVGICGSGLVDAVAELLVAGVIEPSGRVRTPAELEGRAPRELCERIVEQERGRAVRLTDGARPVFLTAQDVREVQLVKASIATAVSLLLRFAGLHAGELREVLLAGAFGSYLSGRSAQLLGLLPEVAAERIRFVGNAAGAGARLALVDSRTVPRAVRLAGAALVLELAGRPEYEAAFVRMLAFPEPPEAG